MSVSPPNSQDRAPSVLPPWWSCLLTLIVVIGAVAGLVILVLALGGRVPPQPAPRLVVLTVDPTALIRQSITMGITPAPSLEPIVNRPQVNFEMSGPSLPTPSFSPTPEVVAVGKTIVVVDVGDQQLNVRDNAGVSGTTVIFRAPEQSQFVIVEGPTQADGLTWWRIQDPNNPNRNGWAASNYLQALPNE